MRPDGSGKVVWFTLPALTTAPEEACTVRGYLEPLPLADTGTAAGPCPGIRGTRVG